MTAPRAVWEVARRELVERSRSRVLRVSLVLVMVVSVGGAIAAARLSGGTPTDDVGLAGPRSIALEPAIRLQAKAAGRRVHLHRLAGPASASRAVRDGTVDVALLDGSRLVVRTSRSQPAVRVVHEAIVAQGLFDHLRAGGLSPAQALGVLAPPARPVDVLEPNPRNSDKNRGVLTLGLSALFLVLVFSGQFVAQGVTEEKSSRVVELLLAATSPRRLLAGKVIGIGVLGLVLLVLPLAAALAAGQLAGGAGLPSAAPKTVALVVLWFVLGYFLYSVAFAGLGALVSRQEDLGTAVLPVTVVLLVAFYGGFLLFSTPNGTAARVAALLPPFAPIAVPTRMVLGDMGAAGLLAAIGLDLLATAGLIVLAAHIYERSILQIGAPVKLRRLIALGKRRSDTAAAKASSPTTGGVGSAASGLSPVADRALRAVGAALILAGAVIGFAHAIAPALAGVGLLLLIVDLALRRRPGRPAR